MRLLRDRQRGWFSLLALLESYHRYRVKRVLHGDDPDTPVGDGESSVGVLGVSFITAH